MRKTKLVCLLLVIVLLVAAPVIASATGETIVAGGVHSADLKWEVSENGTLTLSGDIDFYGSGGKTYPWEAYADVITRVVVEEGIDRIFGSFFDELPNISEVQLPSTVTEIPANAFLGKMKLSSFTVRKEVTAIGDHAFNGCRRLGSIQFEQGSAVESIGNYAFQECGLKAIEIPGSVKALGDCVLSDCQGLKEVKLNDGLQSIGKKAFSGCTELRSLNIPQTVESVGKDVLEFCISLRTLRLDAPVFLGTMYFCDSLTDVTLGEKVTFIPDNMFKNCINLKTITAEAELTAVGEYAFAETPLESFPFTESLTSIGANAFSGTALTEVVLPDSVRQISPGAFSGCQSLRLMDVGAGVETIGNGAFMNCANLTQLDLRHVADIQFEAFAGCTALKNVGWSDRLETVGYHAFKDCASLERVMLPGTFRYLEHSVFKGCTDLKTVCFEGDAPEMGAYNFENVMATVCYPANNDTWTDEVWRENGGTLALVAYEPEIGIVPCGEKLLWMLTSDDTLRISGTGDMDSFAGDADRPWHSLAAKVKKIEIEAGVTGISPGAFAGFTALESVTFMGEAPNLQDGTAVFEGTTAMVYYPAASAYWTEENRDAFGGNITWVTYDNAVDQGSCGENLTWALTTDNTLVIYGTGKMTSTPWQTYKDQYTKLVIGEGVTTICANAFKSSSVLTEVSLPQSLAGISIRAFSDCGALTQIVIPDNIMLLDQSTFAGCVSLESVVLPDGMVHIQSYAFAGCKNLTTIDFPQMLTMVGDRAFAGCVGLKQIVLPEHVTEIRVSAFYNCSDLESVTFLGQIDSIQSNAFEICVGLKSVTFTGDPPTTIASNAFKGVTAVCYYPAGNDAWLGMQNYGGKLTWMPLGENTETIIASGQCGQKVSWSVNDEGTLRIYGSGAMDDFFESLPPWREYLPQIQLIAVDTGVTHVGAYAFYECESVTQVALGKDILSIGEGAFAYSGISKITLPEKLTTIGESAFTGCFALSSIMIPKKVTEIGQYAFAQCENLGGIHVADGNSDYCSYQNILYSVDKIFLIQCPAGLQGPVSCDSFCWVINPGAFAGCKKITGVQMDSVRIIGEGAFAGCTAMESVSIGANTAVIPANAFASCKSLKTVKFTNMVAKIGEGAFSGCTGLKSMTFPASLSIIGEKAFDGCAGLKKITFTGQAPNMDDTAFSGVTAEALYPRDKISWTSDLLKNYGGKLSWKKAPAATLTKLDGGKCSSTVSWKLYENGKLVISGTGAIPNYSEDNGAPWLKHSEIITELVVEQGITDLGDWNFVTPNLISAQLPASLKTISQSAFQNCGKLSGIYVAGDNTAYASEFGVLYNKDKTELLCCPRGYYGEVIVASTTKTIADYAFEYCRSITSVVIPANVTSIGERAFKSCVGTLGFSDGSHTGLSDIYFEGDAPDFGQEAFYFVKATIHYPEGNATWTEEVRQSYGSQRIEWQAEQVNDDNGDGNGGAGGDISGDISGDGAVNNKDLVRLFQHLSGWDVEAYEPAMDINGDGSVNNKDLVRLFQYLSGWDVEIR